MMELLMSAALWAQLMGPVEYACQAHIAGATSIGDEYRIKLTGIRSELDCAEALLDAAHERGER